MVGAGSRCFIGDVNNRDVIDGLIGRLISVLF